MRNLNGMHYKIMKLRIQCYRRQTIWFRHTTHQRSWWVFCVRAFHFLSLMGCFLALLNHCFLRSLWLFPFFDQSFGRPASLLMYEVCFRSCMVLDMSSPNKLSVTEILGDINPAYSFFEHNRHLFPSSERQLM